MFKVRYKEHIHAIRSNKQNSKFAQHMLHTGQTYSTIDQTMEVLHIEKKGEKAKYIGTIPYLQSE
jgi:predicted DNA-binding protein with PD1-like motif